MILPKRISPLILIVIFIVNVSPNKSSHPKDLIIESQQFQIDFLRQSLAKVMCTGKEEVLQTGVWCLQEDPKDNSNIHFPQELGRPLGKGHVTADYEISLF